MHRKLGIVTGLGAVVIAFFGIADGSDENALARLHDQHTIVVGDFVNRTKDEGLHDSLEPAFRAALEESPWLNTLSDVGFAAALKRIGRGTAMTDDLARIVCQQVDGAGYVTG